jgi:hypothetical protein
MWRNFRNRHLLREEDQRGPREHKQIARRAVPAGDGLRISSFGLCVRRAYQDWNGAAPASATVARAATATSVEKIRAI